MMYLINAEQYWKLNIEFILLTVQMLIVIIYEVYIYTFL